MPLRHLVGHLSASPVVYLQPSWCSDVYCAVRCPASAPVEPVECREPRRRRTRCYPAQQNDDSLLEPFRIVPRGDHQLDSALRADALLLEDGPDGCVEVLVATGERLEGDASGERGVGGRDDQGADLLDYGLARLQCGCPRPGQDLQALGHAVPGLQRHVPCLAPGGPVYHRGVVLAPAALDRAVGGASARRPARARARGA